MRWYRTFKSKEERANWEKEAKKADERFKVCFRCPVKELAKEVYLPEEVRTNYKYATVYRYKEDEEA